MTLVTRRLLAALVALTLPLLALPTALTTAPASAVSVRASSPGADPCPGLAGQKGVSDRAITIGNVSDISGPVPGLFQSAQDGIAAYVEWFNAQGTKICGRELRLEKYDARTDADADRQAYRQACRDTFAVVGSASAFDSGGVVATEKCHLPDLRATISTEEAAGCETCFATRPESTHDFAAAVPDYLVSTFPTASEHTALLYLATGSRAGTTSRLKKAWEKRDVSVDYVAGIDISEFNYAPYVQALKDRGIRVVRFDAPYQQTVKLAQAMRQQNYAPTVYLATPSAYVPDYVSQGGDAVDGTRVAIDFSPFEETKDNPELRRYVRWLDEVRPGAAPSVEGLYAWSAGALFTSRATALGKDLTRGALVKALRGVTSWTGRGLHAEQPVGAGTTARCARFIRLDGDTWKPQGGTKFRCGKLVHVD